MSLPRVLIAGTHSGTGKTTVVMGLSAAISARDLSVQTFKAGPDYIDPGFHTVASGRPCRNLDSMLLDEDSLLELFHRGAAGSDISIIEGVMGLFDGVSGSDDRGSAASLARISSTPVILVVDASSMARSAAAIVHGFASFDSSIKLSGVILNRIGSSRHFDMIKEAVESTTNVSVLGYLPRDASITLPERHLGLTPAWEREDFSSYLDHLVEMVESHIDLDKLLRLARLASPFPPHGTELFPYPPEPKKVKIAVAMDRAFHFYYQDNLDMLSHMGAELIEFSPLSDENIPPDASAIYIGGGFPEIFAPELEANGSMREDIREKATLGMPILAECGGLMYLVEAIETAEGDRYAMTGIFPGRMTMGRRLRALGYCDGETLTDTVIGPRGRKVKGHVFHWSSYEGPEDAPVALRLTKGDEKTEEGLANGNVMASYLHIHFGSDRTVPEEFLKSATTWQEKKTSTI